MNLSVCTLTQSNAVLINLKLRHINLCSNNAPKMNHFNRHTFTLYGKIPTELNSINKDKVLVRGVYLVNGLDIQIHLTHRDI